MGDTLGTGSDRESGADSEVGPDLWTFADALPGVVYRCRTDAERTMLSISSGIEEVSGYPASDFLRDGVRRFGSLIHPDDAASVAESVESALATGEPFALRYRIVRADGVTRWVHDQGRGVLLPCGEVRILVGVLLDFTAQLQADQRETRRRHSAAEQQKAIVTLATHSAVARGRVVEASSVATELVTAAANVERASVWLLSDDTQTLELVDLHLRESGEHSRTGSLAASSYPHYFEAMKSGRVVDADDARTDPRTSEFRVGYLEPLGISSMLDAALRVGGEVVGVLCLEHVGDKRSWDPHEIQFAGEVADQVAHALLNRSRLEALQEQERLQEQLFHVQKLEAVGRLAGGIAHDFNNLLTVIAVGAEEFLDGHAQNDAARLCARDILEATTRAADLAQQLLTFSRREDVQPYSLDLAAAVFGAEASMKVLVSRGVELSVAVESSPLPVLATEGWVHQILGNLVVNASDAMPDGGRLRIWAGQVEDPDGAPPCACIRVQDEGVGMSAELQGEVFEPFFTTKEAGKGTGLGLSTVFGIVGRCGGTLRLRSELGRGSEFTILLPISDDDTSMSSSETEAPELSIGPGRRLLVVDDNAGVLLLTRRLLEKAGFEVETAKNADEAILRLRSIHRDGVEPDTALSLVLSDVVMPGGGGLGVFRWVREHLPDLPVRFMSGYVDRETERHAPDVPMIAKPFSGPELLKFVSEGLVHSKD